MSRSGRRDAPAIAQPMVAAGRDATFLASPNHRSPRMNHIATVEGTAACNPGPEWNGCTPLDMDLACPADEVYDDWRCGRPGCRVQWDKVPSKPRTPAVTTTGSNPSGGDAR